MTSCAIMQPTYLPWPGYFNLIASSDVFVFLDDAQFQRSSWHCRNRILLNRKVIMLSVPVLRTGLSTRLCDAEIDYSRDWRKSHEGSIRQAYSRLIGGKQVIELLTQAFEDKPRLLVEMNISIITSICRILMINTPLALSSTLNIIGHRSDRLVRICRSLDANTYLSPAGSAGYLNEDGFEQTSDISLYFQKFDSTPYAQPEVDEFAPYLSVIDLIANLGPEGASEYIRKSSFRLPDR